MGQIIPTKRDQLEFQRFLKSGVNVWDRDARFPPSGLVLGLGDEHNSPANGRTTRKTSSAA
jgi:hypothetical protein